MSGVRSQDPFSCILVPSLGVLGPHCRVFRVREGDGQNTYSTLYEKSLNHSQHWRGEKKTIRNFNNIEVAKRKQSKTSQVVCTRFHCSGVLLIKQIYKIITTAADNKNALYIYIYIDICISKYKYKNQKM